MFKPVRALMTSPRFLLWAFLGVGALCFRFVFATPKVADHFIWSLSYWFTMGVFIWFIYELIRIIRARITSWIRTHAPALCGIACVCFIIHVNEPHFLKVTADEPAHVSASLFMHLNRQVGLPINVSVPAEVQLVDSYSAPFRGHLFSFILSLVHDITGYRVANVYWLNCGLGFGFLCVLYMLGLEFVSKQSIAFAGVLLYASAPIFGQVMCSGSYDILNLLFIALLCLFLIRLTSRKSEGGEYLLLAVLSSVLLAYSRPESLVYYALVVFALFYRLATRTDSPGVFPSYFVISPLMFLPAMATQIVLLANPVNLAQNYLGANEVMLSFDHVQKNWMDTLVYFTNSGGVAMSSVLLFVLGLIFGGLLIVRYSNFLRQGLPWARYDVRVVWVFLFSALIMGLYTMVMASFWGGANNPVMTRFTLPLWFMLSLFFYSGIMVLGDTISSSLARFLPAVAAGYFYVFCLPVHSVQSSKQTLYIGYHNHKVMEWISSQDNNGVLYVGSSSLIFLPHQVASINMRHLSMRPLNYVRLVKAGVLKKIVLVELRLVNPNDGKTIVHETDWRASADLWKGKRLWSYAGMLGMEIVAEELTGVTIDEKYYDLTLKDGRLPTSRTFVDMQNTIIQKAVGGDF